MFVLVEDAAQAFTPAYVEAGDLPWIGDRPRQGVQRSRVRDALMRPMGVVEPLELPQGVAVAAMAGAYVDFAARNPALYEAMFSLDTASPLPTRPHPPRCAVYGHLDRDKTVPRQPKKTGITKP